MLAMSQVGVPADEAWARVEPLLRRQLLAEEGAGAATGSWSSECVECSRLGLVRGYAELATGAILPSTP